MRSGVLRDVSVICKMIFATLSRSLLSLLTSIYLTRTCVLSSEVSVLNSDIG